ncbi:bifunctional serine/threonine-protein kinase/formylglycine-generating enzyme family protein [Myxococcus stipitatus]|uniref:nSTAND1 domain-containing NTPase n=1 Tax=Myxococcus stipitatus TaxID=83455 RepID=UPI001F1BB48D|nr:bifunctional serine/threonine-protein kinase/formylglycine-generating enzyme family protein [Myxococcus stipitatus]MCE9666319.1 bifunctional serine/threonine-protein kinase/formylglycine-generating enzyme family protein [Myxococcus stipitatus]
MRSPASVPGAIEVGSQVDGFRIVRFIAEGAMGEVFLAQDVELGRRVALKFLKVELLGAAPSERLFDEARTIARFSHPHIVTVHAVGWFQGRPYLALEYVDGETLRERLAREKPGLNDSLRICRAIAEAIAEAHQHGIVHADLKPENILIPRDGRVRVVDFGLARHAGGEHGAASGTPAYMAPERWKGALPSPAMDVWSLGVIACELLEGRRPLDDVQLAQFAFSPMPLALSPRVRELPGGHVLEECLAITPEARPSARIVAQAMSEALVPGPHREGNRAPFRGLRPFTESDAEDFFGRELELDGFVERLRHEALVPLIGPSGIGKSSFLHAGVFARFRQMEQWTVLHARPGPRPLTRLAAMLVSGLEDAPPASTVAESLARRPGEVVSLLRRRHEAAGGNVLLALDAFEEVFTLASPTEATQVAACLMAAASVEDPWRIVLVLRDDYLGHFSRLEPLRPTLGAAFVLAKLTPAAIQEAVTAPLRRVGYAVDAPSLLGRLVDEVQAQPMGLPLLQFVCMALWDRRDVASRLLRASVYESLGGAAGALASHAQQFLQQLPAEEVGVARTLLLRLVTVEGMRRPRPLPELLEGLSSAAPGVLEKLQSNRLVGTTRDPQTDEPLVELAHESLATTWPALTHWVAETREERTLVQQLEEAARLWDQRGRPDEETWSDEPLRQAMHRVANWNIPLPTRSRAFLEAGQRRARKMVRRRHLLLGGFVSLLVMVSLSSMAAALAFRENQLEAIRQQALIRLVSADIGRFDLVLESYDFDPVSQRWAKAALSDVVDWRLVPAQGITAPDAATAYREPDLRRQPPESTSHGVRKERVEAPSRSAWLFVDRAGCAPSVIHLERLPGYRERDQVPIPTLQLPIPTCAASRLGMIPIPAGPYWRPGDDEAREPERLVEVAGFSLDQTEVTNGQFRLFEERVLPRTPYVRELPPQHPIFSRSLEMASPVTGLDAASAEAFCRYMGKSLPTADEWRKGFRGGLVLDARGRQTNPAPKRNTVWLVSRKFPPTNLMGHDPYPGVAPVGSFPEDQSPYGIMDLAGNVAEWTETTESQGNFQNLRRVMGGRWDVPPEEGHHRAAWSNHLPPRRFEFGIGMRCVERTASPRG